MVVNNHCLVQESGIFCPNFNLSMKVAVPCYSRTLVLLHFLLQLTIFRFKTWWKSKSSFTKTVTYTIPTGCLYASYSIILVTTGSFGYGSHPSGCCHFLHLFSILAFSLRRYLPIFNYFPLPWGHLGKVSGSCIEAHPWIEFSIIVWRHFKRLPYLQLWQGSTSSSTPSPILGFVDLASCLQAWFLHASPSITFSCICPPADILEGRPPTATTLPRTFWWFYFLSLIT